MSLHNSADDALSWLNRNHASTLTIVETNSFMVGIKVEGTLYYPPWRIYMSIVDTFGLRLNIHIGSAGFLSILWAGHVSFVCINPWSGMELVL